MDKVTSVMAFFLSSLSDTTVKAIYKDIEEHINQDKGKYLNDMYKLLFSILQTELKDRHIDT